MKEGTIHNLVTGFEKSFNGAFAKEFHKITDVLKDEKANIGGFELKITYHEENIEIEFPQIGCVYTHMLEHDCHSIVAGEGHANVIIAQLKRYKENGYNIENSKVFQNPKKIEFIMLILFLIPGTPKDLLVYVAGLLPIKPLKFIIISTFARFPSVITSTLAGEQLAIGDWKMSIILYVAILILVALAVFIINKFDKDKITKDAIKSIK